MLTIQKRLIKFLRPYAANSAIADVRIGLGYTAVKLKSGQAGVAWTPPEIVTGCTHFAGAGTLAGRPADQLLAMLGDESSSLTRAIGLATANAVLAALPESPAAVKDEVITSLQITHTDRVAMVGYFGPIAAQLRQTGCQLDILELNEQRDTLPPEKADDVLEACTIAIITGTTLINDTLDDLMSCLGKPRAAVLLGPSSPLCSDVFQDTKLTHIAGSRVSDADAVLRIVSEGGGTMLMKRYLDFKTVLIKQ